MDDLYDEFGNFIGEAPESDEEDQKSETGADAYVDYDEDASVADHEGAGQQLMELDDEGLSNAVVLHEGQAQFWCEKGGIEVLISA